MIPRLPILFAAQARFPAPEFESYTLPQMSLEELASDSVLWRVLILAVFLAAGTWFFYKLRSRRALLAYSVAGLAVFGFLFASCPCPVGMFQNIAEGLASGSYIQPGVLLLFALPLAVALFAGRVFCGGACPLGAIQELLHWKSIFIPRPLDRVLRLLPVLLLLIFTVCAIYGIGFPLCYLEPYLPVFLLDFATPFAILSAVFLAAGLFISRPFCRYVCPYGVLLRFFSMFSLLKPRITSHDCVNCRLCEQGCPNGAVLPPENAGTA
ncbi:MAG: 4Fe-4S binding protein, partial [Lentisphaeria bacterium]|nr:4Fe-4S binding protein [Lentisphaeria bacterium]